MDKRESLERHKTMTVESESENIVMFDIHATEHRRHCVR
jgi:hypothetical protein